MARSTREAILTAAAELMRHKGYGAVGMKDIAAASGAPIGSLYHHFPGGKVQIARAALINAGAAYALLIPAVVDDHTDLGQALHAVFAQAAQEAEVAAVVNMSQISARRDATSNAAQQHWIAERLLDRAPVAVTHLRPTFFAEWLLYFGSSIAERSVLRLPFGHGRHAPIAAEDQAHVIAAILEDPGPHAGQIYPLFGPVEDDHHGIVAEVARTLGRPVRYEPIEIDKFRNRMIQSRNAAPHIVQHIENVAVDYRQGKFAGTNDIVERIGRTTPTTVAAFMDKRRAKFDSAPN